MDARLHALQKRHLDALATYAQLIHDAAKHLEALMDMESTPDLPTVTALDAAGSPLGGPVAAPGESRCTCGHSYEGHQVHGDKVCTVLGCACDKFISRGKES